MNKIFIGYDKEAAKNWDRIFKKSLLQRIEESIDKILFRLFLEEKKEKC